MNERRIDRVCQLLLGRMNLVSLWTAHGPSDQAIQYLEEGSPLSSGEHLMLLVCFDLFNDTGKATIGRILNVFDESHVRALADFMRVIRVSDPRALDGWIAGEEALQERRGVAR